LICATLRTVLWRDLSIILNYRKIKNSFRRPYEYSLQVDGFLDKVSSNEEVGGVMLVCSLLVGCHRAVPGVQAITNTCWTELSANLTQANEPIAFLLQKPLPNTVHLNRCFCRYGLGDCTGRNFPLERRAFCHLPPFPLRNGLCRSAHAAEEATRPGRLPLTGRSCLRRTGDCVCAGLGQSHGYCRTHRSGNHGSCFARELACSSWEYGLP